MLNPALATTPAFRLLALLTLGMGAVCLLMLAVWVLSQRLKNAGIVDVAWSAWFTLLALLYALFADGAPRRRILIALLVSIWSLRLATHLFIRVRKAHPVEDKRYTALRDEWKPDDGRKMLIFFQQQGISNVILSVPFALIALDRNPEFGPLVWSGIAVWLVAIVGEGLADHQLEQFKSEPDNKGKSLQSGLWRYSRHPNYFCEFLIWCGFYLMALESPWGWITVYCPLGILFILLKVTGVPMAEEQSLKNRGDEYRDYQRRTNKFFPWIPKQ